MVPLGTVAMELRLAVGGARRWATSELPSTDAPIGVVSGRSALCGCCPIALRPRRGYAFRRKASTSRLTRCVPAPDETEVPAGAGSTRSSLLLLYWSKHLAATGSVDKQH
jgi:hypothetical protein